SFKVAKKMRFIFAFAAILACGATASPSDSNAPRQPAQLLPFYTFMEKEVPGYNNPRVAKDEEAVRTAKQKYEKLEVKHLNEVREWEDYKEMLKVEEIMKGIRERREKGKKN
ncbi:hypothetical protein MCOR25_011124, partial [Pyricularia grisea]